MYTVTISKSGQITLPKELREFLGVKIGERITFRKKRDEVSIARRISDEEFLERLDAMKTPETRAFLKKNGARLAKQSISEMKDEWAKSAEGKKYFEEKYGVR